MFRFQEVYIDPITLKPDLYAASVANNTQKVIEYLNLEVPGTFIDTATGWTVSVLRPFCIRKLN